MTEIEPEIQISETLAPLDVARRCKHLMTEYRKIYIDHQQVRTSDPPVPTRGHEVIHQALDYGVGTTDGVIHFLELGQPWFAANIVRAYFELALRMMWCRIGTKNAWLELIGSWAKETIKAADRSVKDLGQDPLTKTARELLTEQASHAPRKPPTLHAMLEAIAARQPSAAVRAHIERTYAELFTGSLHQAAHVNLAFLSLHWPGKDPLAIGAALVRACWWVINSSYLYIAWNDAQAIEFMNSHFKV